MHINVSLDKCRWELVNGFVGRFNDHVVANFNLGSGFCVYESMIRWHGYGSNYADNWLSHCINIKHKLENGLEMKN